MCLFCVLVVFILCSLCVCYMLSVRLLGVCHVWWALCMLATHFVCAGLCAGQVFAMCLPCVCHAFYVFLRSMLPVCVCRMFLMRLARVCVCVCVCVCCVPAT